MILFHGSPHRFDAFDSSRFATGQGFQTYGIGFYLTTSAEVAADYASGWRVFLDGALLMTSRTSEAVGRHAQPGTTGNKLLDGMLRRYVGDVAGLLADIRERPAMYPAINEADFRAIEKPAAALLGRVTVERTAYLYSVRFAAAESDLLFLDLPLEEQPGAVRELVEPVVATLNARFYKRGAKLMAAAIVASAKRGRAIEAEFLRLGFKGSMQSFPHYGTREFVAYSPDDLSIIDVRTLH